MHLSFAIWQACPFLAAIFVDIGCRVKLFVREVGSRADAVFAASSQDSVELGHVLRIKRRVRAVAPKETVVECVAIVVEVGGFYAVGSPFLYCLILRPVVAIKRLVNEWLRSASRYYRDPDAIV